jgi:hypothetical protein
MQQCAGCSNSSEIDAEGYCEQCASIIAAYRETRNEEAAEARKLARSQWDRDAEALYAESLAPMNAERWAVVGFGVKRTQEAKLRRKVRKGR